MPISTYVTKKQIAQAREVGLLSYLRTSEPNNLKRTSQTEYRLKGYGGLVISNGKWNWFTGKVGGKTTNTVDFLMKVKKMDFVSAVQLLTGEETVKISKSVEKLSAPEQDKVFSLPKPNRTNEGVLSYLESRGISRKTTEKLIKMKLLYQSEKQTCVFVGYDKNMLKYAFERSIKSDLKKDVYGSDKEHSFVIPAKEPQNTTAAIFESPIDAISHAEIHRIDNKDKFTGYRLSLGGTSDKALKSFLEKNADITTLHLCLDNDEAGKTATERIIKELLSNEKYNHINIIRSPPPFGKDYSETLQVIKQKQLEKVLNTKEAEEISKFNPKSHKPIRKKTDISL